MNLRFRQLKREELDDHLFYLHVQREEIKIPVVLEVQFPPDPKWHSVTFLYSPPEPPAENRPEPRAKPSSLQSEINNLLEQSK